jgi:hypothetical protein
MQRRRAAMRCAGALVFWAGLACEDRTPPLPVVLELDGDTVLLTPGAIILDVTVGGRPDFTPDTAQAVAGDVIRVRSLDSGPHAVGFDVAASDTSAIRFLASTDQIRALPLLEPEARWIVSLENAPSGLYVLVCLTHGARAELRVTDSRTGRRR